MISYDKTDIKLWVNKMLDGKKIYKRLATEIKRNLPEVKKKSKKGDRESFIVNEIGRFVFDEENNWFSNEYEFNENDIVLNILVDERSKAEKAIISFERIMEHLIDIEVISRGYAINQLISINSDVILDTEKSFFSFEEMTQSMTLESIGVHEDESISFWYYYEKSISDGRIIMIRFTSEEIISKLEFLGLN